MIHTHVDYPIKFCDSFLYFGVMPIENFGIENTCILKSFLARSLKLGQLIEDALFSELLKKI